MKPSPLSLAGSQTCCTVCHNYFARFLQTEWPMQCWKEKWEWDENVLFHTTIGALSSIIMKLKEGVYKPNVSNGVKRSALARMKVKTNQDARPRDELQHDLKNMHDTTLVDNNSQKHVVVAEIPIIDFTEDDEEDVKATLQNGPSLNSLGIPLSSRTWA